VVWRDLLNHLGARVQAIGLQHHDIGRHAKRFTDSPERVVVVVEHSLQDRDLEARVRKCKLVKVSDLETDRALSAVPIRDLDRVLRCVDAYKLSRLSAVPIPICVEAVATADIQD